MQRPTIVVGRRVFPYDVVHRIVQYLVDDSEAWIDPSEVDALFHAYSLSSPLTQTLRACSLVGRAWTFPCQRELFRVVDIASTAELARVCDVLERSRLRPRGMRLSLDDPVTEDEMLRAVRRLRDVAGVPDHLWVETGQVGYSESARPSLLLRCCSRAGLVPQESLTLRKATFADALEFTRTLRPYTVCPLLRLVACSFSRTRRFEMDPAAWDDEPPLEMRTLELHACDFDVMDIELMISRIERLHFVLLGMDGTPFPSDFLSIIIPHNTWHISALHIDARCRVGSSGSSEGDPSPDIRYVA
jgi:hypothetical protein